MATAAELLASAYTSDNTLVIDNFLRTIQIPSSITNLGVENDDEVLRLNFRMPRYLGQTDLSTFSARINYLNAQGEDDAYDVGDLTIDGENLTFSWLVGPTATRYKGNTKFNVCMRLLDDNSYVQKEYNTTIASLPVLEGLEAEPSLVEAYSDILEQWKNQLFGIGDTEEAKLLTKSEEEQQKIIDKGVEVLASIPENYETTYNLALEGVRTKADAIICSATGDGRIHVPDSSNDYLRQLQIFGKTTQRTTTGKNLLDHSFNSQTVNGVTLTVADDGSVTVNGTSTANCILLIGTFSFEPGVEYILSGCPSGGSDTTYRMDLRDGDTVTWREYGDGMVVYTSVEADLDVCIRLHGNSTKFNNVVFRPMIRLASIDDPTYEPYTGGKPSPSPRYPQELVPIVPPTVSVHGKNMFDANTCEIYNDQGVNSALGTAVVDGNKIILKKATAASYFYGQYINVIPGETYTISFIGGANNAGDAHALYVYSNKPFGTAIMTLTSTTHASKTFVATSSRIFVGVYVCGTTTTTEELVYTNVQLELGSTASSYVSGVAVQSIDPVSPLMNRPFAGIPVSTGGNYVDSNGQQWICDEIDYERGVHIQRIGFFNLADVSVWTTQTSWVNKTAFFCGNALTASVPVPGYFTTANLMCDRLLIGTPDSISNGFTNAIGQGANAGLYVSIDGVGSAEQLVAYFKNNRTILVYALAKPVEFSLNPAALQQFKMTHTNHPNTFIVNDSGAGMTIKYNTDLKIWISDLVANTTSNSRPVIVDDVTGLAYILRVSDGELMIDSV